MQELLLLLSDYPFKEANKNRLRELLKEVGDWGHLVQLINSHGIIALAAYNISESGLEREVPGKALDILNGGLLKNITRNTWLKERWKELNRILTDAGISHVLLKGMALEHTIYGSRGLRQMTDIDILVDEESAEEASAILLSNGFITAHLKSKLFSKIQSHIGKHYPTFEKDGLMVDMHVRLLGNIFKKEDISSSTDLILIDGLNPYILKKKIHIRYLIDHFRSHAVNGDCQFRLYRDIKLLDPEADINFPVEFVEKPKQGDKPSYRRAQYKSAIKSIPTRYRLLYLVGDIFPSIGWMKKRYHCSTIGAIVRYPLRMFKLARLF